MAYIYEGSKTEGAEIGSKKESEKRENSTIVSPILIYDIAENKQVRVLVFPICHHLYLSLSEGTHTPWWVPGAKNGKGRDYAQSLMLKVTPLHHRQL